MAGLLSLDQKRPPLGLLDPNPVTNPAGPEAAQMQAPIWGQAAQLPVDAAKAWWEWRKNRPPLTLTDIGMGFMPMGMLKGLRPAILGETGALHIGKLGDLHSDIPHSGQPGFATPEGRFLTRDEAAAALNAPRAALGAEDLIFQAKARAAGKTTWRGQPLYRDPKEVFK